MLARNFNLGILRGLPRGQEAMGVSQGGEAQALPLGRARGLIPRAKSKQFKQRMNLLVGKIVIGMLFFLISSLVWAEVPIVDYSSDNGSIKHDTVRDNVAASDGAVMPVPEIEVNSGTISAANTDEVVVQPQLSESKSQRVAEVSDVGLTLEQRINRMRQQINHLNQQNSARRIEELEQRIQQLSGQLEMQQHQIEQLSAQVRNFYQDLNQRLMGRTESKLVGGGQGLVLNNTGKWLAPEAPSSNGNVGQDVSALASPSSVAGGNDNGGGSNSKKNAVKQAPVSSTLASDAASLKEQQLYQTAIDLLPDRKYDDSAAKLRVYIATFPNGAYISNAYYWLGEIYFLQKKFNLASNQFKIVMNKYPTSKKVADAALKLALIHDSQGSHQQAANEFRQIKKRYPNTAAAQLAAQQLQVMGK